jgi:hypothetical protein
MASPSIADNTPKASKTRANDERRQCTIL